MLHIRGTAEFHDGRYQCFGSLVTNSGQFADITHQIVSKLASEGWIAYKGFWYSRSQPAIQKMERKPSSGFESALSHRSWRCRLQSVFTSLFE